MSQVTKIKKHDFLVKEMTEGHKWTHDERVASLQVVDFKTLNPRTPVEITIESKNETFIVV